ncbi:flagellar biosynthesis protein FlgN [Sphingosinicella sp. BN140058]|uniref:flagellar biosynthesis protein FlgN n=1 Tax=Sphingosinicella sp. BN140058 TaxID=1892855 RepID=UPI0010123D73|nr:flagellar biosynthesis protein FlgN [Sphingosinicella sp. BN140058]QAY76634.1 flagellar biosynthesis protein FlgN [Sphingosinicella sp. BN140058]
MVSELVDLVKSLAALMREETELLRSGARSAGIHEIAGAKARLVGALEARTTELDRSDANWLEALEEEPKAELIEALGELKDASGPNAEALSRQIDLTTEMMAAVTAEAKRIIGTRHSVYGARGNLSRLELPTPISHNSHY